MVKSIKKENDPENCLECKFCYTNENENNFCCGIDGTSDDMGNNITPCNEGIKKSISEFSIISFPDETLKKMIQITEENNDKDLVEKLITIQNMKLNLYRKNRWFGYYQRIGEEKSYWSLSEIIEMVRKEFDNKIIKKIDNNEQN